MPVDNVIPSKHYEGVVTGFFSTYSTKPSLYYDFGKVPFAYARANTVLLLYLIPAHLEVPLSILITKEIRRIKFPKG